MRIGRCSSVSGAQRRWASRCYSSITAGEADFLAAGPITQAALEEASADAAWRRLPSWFLFGAEEDRNIPAAVHRFMAERAGSRRTVELAGGSHTVAIPEAATVADLIEEAVVAVTAPVAAR